MSWNKINNHLHEYERSQKNPEVYRCVHPRCSHYQQRHLLVGKEATCGKCKLPFKLGWKSLKRKTPVCDYCTKSPKAAALRAVRDALNEELNNEFKLPEEFTSFIHDRTEE